MTHREKYSRQILFAPIGEAGQARLARSRVAIIGCGALGTVQASQLARAGVGTLRIVDRDFVEESNLQRQVLFDESDAAQNLPKAVAAERKLRAINSDIAVEGVVADFEPRNAEELVRGFAVILDGTDNFEARYLLNDVAVKSGVPWIYGAAVGSYAATMTIRPKHTACLACVFPAPPERLGDTCDTVGVIAPAVAWAAAIQVTETLKLLLGRFAELHGKLMSADIWENRFQEVRPRRDTACRVCAVGEFKHLSGSSSSAGALCGRNAVQIRQSETRVLDLTALQRRLEPFGPVHGNNFLVRFELEPFELTVFRDGRAIVKGTDDPAVARGLYAKYIGS